MGPQGKWRPFGACCAVLCIAGAGAVAGAGSGVDEDEDEGSKEAPDSGRDGGWHAYRKRLSGRLATRRADGMVSHRQSSSRGAREN